MGCCRHVCAVAIVLLLLAVICNSAVFTKKYSGHKIVIVHPITLDHQAVLQGLVAKYDLLESTTIPGRSTSILVSDTNLDNLINVLEGNDLTFHVAVDDVGRLLNEYIMPLVDVHENNAIQCGMTFGFRKEVCPNGAPSMDWQSYHGYGSITSWLEDLAAKHSDLASVINIGKSFQGRNIKVLKISSNKSRKNVRKIWIDSLIHAREWTTGSVVTYFINEMLENYPKHKDFVDSYEWYICPVMNPDGYVYSMAEDPLWRKNRNDTLKKTGSKQCTGVDLNRNWGVEWRKSDHPCSEIYSGANPFSESESAAVAKFIKHINKDGNVDAMISYHSFSQVILCPPAYTSTRSSDHRDYEQVMRAAARALEGENGRHYLYGTAPELLYLAYGIQADWMKESAGIVHSYVIELPPKSTDVNFGMWPFQAPTSELLSIGRENFAGLKAMLKELQRVQSSGGYFSWLFSD